MPAGVGAVKDMVFVMMLIHFLTIVMEGGMSAVIFAVLILRLIAFLTIDIPGYPGACVFPGRFNIDAQGAPGEPRAVADHFGVVVFVSVVVQNPDVPVVVELIAVRISLSAGHVHAAACFRKRRQDLETSLD